MAILISILLFGLVAGGIAFAVATLAQKQAAPARPAYADDRGASRDKTVITELKSVAGKRLRLTNRAEPSGYITTKDVTTGRIFFQYGHFYLEYDAGGVGEFAFRLDRLIEVVDLATGEAFPDIYGWLRSVGFDTSPFDKA